MIYASMLLVIFNTLLIGSFIFGFYYLLVVLPAKIRKAHTDFANSHGLQYDPKNRVVNYKGTLKGHAGQIVNGVDKQTKQNVEIYQYIHVVGSGKNRRQYDRTVLALSIKKTNVHIFVNSKVNDATEQIDLEKSQRYSAEGDFGKYFDIYSADGKNIESLSIFAPDAMSFLMAECGFNDIEIVGNTIYLYEYKLLNTQQELETFYQLGNRLAKVINDNAPKSLNLNTTQGSPEASAITALKKSKFRLLAVPATVFVVYAVFFFQGFASNSSTVGTGDNSAPPIIFPIIWLVIIVGVIFKLIKAQRLKKRYLEDRQKFFNDHVKKS